MQTPRTSDHAWTFFRSGGLYQVSLATRADILALGELDPKLWVALSCPVRGLELDEKTLALIDTDKDGHIRVPEVVAAAQWAAARIRDPGDLLTGAAVLRIEAIDQDADEGRSLASAARQILARLGRPDAPAIGVDDTADPAKLFTAGRPAGNGVITPDLAKDPDTQRLIGDILASLGGQPGAGGAAGVTAAKAKAFLDEAAAFAAWAGAGEDPAVAVLGGRTAAAYAAVTAVRLKVDDYFARCRLAAFDPRSLDHVNRPGADYAAVASGELTAGGREIAGFPLAPAAAGRPLPLLQGVNPAWARALAALHRDAVAPLLGPDRTALSEGDWAALTGRFAAYEGHLASKAGAPVESLGLERVRAILAGSGRAELDALLAEDAATAPLVASVADLNRLCRYVRDLRTLLLNFVNFADFYSTDRLAVFQAGILFVDNRSCELCIRVEDAAAHAALAKNSLTFIAYVDCRRPDGKAMKVAACVTQGDTDFLYVGRNGLFVDRAGRDWDAVITKIIDNPTSIRQAFFAPYKRVAHFVEEQFASFAAAKDKVPVDVMVKDAAAKAADIKPAAQPFDIAKFAGIFAAIGLALGAIGGAAASVATGFLQLAPWQMPVAVAAALILISGPSMLLAGLKLRKRNLGPILEASGWAVNGMVKITRPLGNALTELAALPPGSVRLLHDPYADKAPARRRAIATLVVIVAAAAFLAWKRGWWPFR